MSIINDHEEQRSREFLERRNTTASQNDSLRKSLNFRKEKILAALGKLDYDPFNCKLDHPSKEELLQRLQSIESQLDSLKSFPPRKEIIIIETKAPSPKKSKDLEQIRGSDPSRAHVSSEGEVKVPKVLQKGREKIKKVKEMVETI